MMQMFVKVDDSKTVTLGVVLSDKVKGVKRRIQNKLRCSSDDACMIYQRKSAERK